MAEPERAHVKRTRTHTQRHDGRGRCMKRKHCGGEWREKKKVDSQGEMLRETGRGGGERRSEQ